MADFISLDDLPGAASPQAIPPSPDQAPSWGDYGGYLASGASNALADLASGGSYAVGKLGDPDAELALSKLSTATRTVGADQQSDLSPGGQNALTSWDHPLSHIVAAGLQSAPSLAAPVISGAMLGPVAAAAAMAGQSASQYLGAVQDHLDGVPDDTLQEHSPMYAGLRSMMPEDQARDQFRDALADNNYGLLANAVAGAVAGSGWGGFLGAVGKGTLGRAATSAAQLGAENAGLAATADYTTQTALAPAGVPTNPDYTTDITTAGVLGALGGAIHGAVDSHVDVTRTATGPDAAQDVALKTSLNGSQPGIGPKGAEVLNRNSPAPPEVTPSPAAPAPEKIVDLTGMGKGMTDNLYAGLFKSLQDGKDTFAGIKDSALVKAKPAFDAGLIKSPDDLRAFLNGQLKPTDVGQNVPEAPATLAAQQGELEQGKRPAVLYPKGTIAPDVPEGMKQARIKEGVVHFDPDQLQRKDVFAASKNNTLNDLLGLGPVNKDQVAASAAQGNPLVAVTERQPDGTSTKEAVGTTGTAPEQVAALEANKQPGNTVGVETPQSVLAGRMFQDPLETQPRDVGTESQAPANPGERSSANAVTTEGNAAGAERRMYSPEPPAKSLGAGANLPRPKPFEASAEKGAKSLILQQTGLYARDTAHVQSEIEPLHKIEHSLSAPEKELFADYIETRSTSPELRDDLPGRLRDYADRIRGMMKDFRFEIERLDPKDTQDFIEDYLPHVWKDNAPFSAWKSLSEHRTIPTIAEGLERGFELKHDTIAGSVQEYAAQMNKFLASKEIEQQLYKQQAIQDKWEPGKKLINTGRFTRKPMYASEKVANDYNTFYSQGTKSETLKAIKEVNNLSRAVSFFGPPFHLANELMQTLGQSIGESIEQFASGHPLRAGQKLAEAPIRPVTAFLAGNKAMQEWRGENRDISAIGKRLQGPDKKAFEALVQANVPQGRNSIDLHFEGQSLLTEFNRRGFGGVLKNELQGAMHGAIEAWQKGQGKGAMRPPVTLIAGTRALVRGFTRALTQTSEPLFSVYIPRLKLGLAMSRMNDWIAANPHATPEETNTAATKIRRNLDNTIGEMTRDNQFWAKWAATTADIVFLAPSWNIGTARTVGDAAKGLANIHKNPMSLSSKDWNLAITTLAGEVGGLLAVGAALTFMHTGRAPQGFTDLVAPPTGGTNDRGEPDRIKTPGEVSFLTELMSGLGMPGGGAAGFYPAAFNPSGPIISKLNPMPGALLEVGRNRDYRDKPIITADTAPGAALQIIQHVFGAVTPFAWSPHGSMSSPVSSGITIPERALGISEAGMAYTNPQGFRGMLENKAARSGGRTPKYNYKNRGAVQ